MWKLKTYQILSILLLPVAVLFTISGLFSLSMVVGNPSLLLPFGILSATVMYIFFSFQFLTKGILRNIQCQASLKDWIKVNAYVTLVFALMCIVQFISVSLHPELLDNLIVQMKTMQQKEAPSPDLFYKTLKGILFGMLAIGVVLIGHVLLTFTLLKKHEELFQ